MYFTDWLSNNYIETFGAVTGILYVFLEIRQNIWLWPVGIITSAVYIWIFLSGKLYADMSLQVYYLVISILGWYWWIRGSGQRAKSKDHGIEKLRITKINLKTASILAVVFSIMFALMWIVLGRFTDSPVPAWDSFITSLSIVATWMLARKIYEHWYLWITVNIAAAFLFFNRGLYPTLLLYVVYCAMSFVGLIEWKKSLMTSKS